MTVGRMLCRDKKTENTETKALYSLFKVLHAENENLVSIHSCNVSLRAMSYFSSLFYAGFVLPVPVVCGLISSFGIVDSLPSRIAM